MTWPLSRSSTRPAARKVAPRGPRRLIEDVGLWAVLTPSAVPLALDRRDAPTFWWELAGLLALIATAVLSHRRFPALAMFGAAVLVMANVWFSLTLLVMSCLAGRRMPSPRPALLTFAAILASGSVLNLVLRAEAWAWFTTLCALPLVMFFPWLAGRYLRLQHEVVVSGWERAARLERERDLLAGQARLLERARMARDMHDSLGHQLALIALQAGALEVRSDLAPQHLASVARLRESAVRATDGLRETIGALRDDAEPVPAEPLDRSIPELVEEARTSGMTIDLREEGEAELSDLTDLAARRVVLESLTNAGKHAPGGVVTVEVRHGTRESTVRVTNQPPPGLPSRRPGHGGSGLVGLDERVRLVGGTLRSGPLDDGGFEVYALLPQQVRAATPAGPGLTVGPPLNPSASLTGSRSSCRTVSLRHEVGQARRRTRRGLALTVGALAAGVAIAAALALSLVLRTLDSSLRPSEFERVEVGQSRQFLERALPRHEYEEGERSAAGGARPPNGANCRYYRATSDIFTPADVYRLCFVEDRLASKNAFPPQDH
ncbi:histidine kinase [Streptomyces uncialis]|uniref:sensor histidine kinase n=1 Tax=Streptomyces uncialis TaxID=1048205 RepID=UPI002E34684C|nr:histidine kinase [Streptomyces uncialis]